MQDTRLWLIQWNMISTFYPAGLSTLRSLRSLVSMLNYPTVFE